MNIRIALACTALGALAAGGAVAQDHNTAAYQQCDRANPSRTPQACNRNSWTMVPVMGPRYLVDMFGHGLLY